MMTANQTEQMRKVDGLLGKEVPLYEGWLNKIYIKSFIVINL